MMGHQEMWAANEEKNRLYANPDATEDDYMKAAELEGVYAEYDGYTAEARAGELLAGVGIPNVLHEGLMSGVAPGWKLRVLLAQALFSDPDILLLDEPTNNLDINTIRWLENILNNRNSTMIIISHDRHFLNQVCTHTADMDYAKLTIYPGNYDDFMEASSMARAQQLKANDKAKLQIAELQDFVRRFSANASKAKQATSRAKQIDKIKVEDMKPSSRQYPFIRFEYDEKDKLYRQALIVNKVDHAFDEPLFNNLNFMVEAGERIAIIGENGIGKSSLLKIIGNILTPNSGSVKWTEKAKLGYFAQDHSEEFQKDVSVFEWMSQWGRPEDDDQVIRSMLGRLLFSGEDFKKKIKVLSGGEQGRMLFGKLMLLKTNILLLDEPTNHMDMESIESLNTALDKFKGTLFFVTHDREFVSSIATRILDIRKDKIIDFMGNYEDYLSSQED
jgi:ATPase subunit of ABC transporter with duplicated ATPase domains